MFETVYAQLRFAASVLLTRPFHLPSLDRLVDGLLATHAEFGEIGGEAKALLAGPILDDETRQQIQFRRIRTQAVRGARETDYYAGLFHRLGLDPARLTPKQIHQIPLTGKDALRAQPAAFVRHGQRPVLRAMTTGTTGRSTTAYFTQRELATFSALAAIGFLTRGVIAPQDVVQVSTSARGSLANSVFMTACQRIGALVYQTGIVEPEQSLALLAERSALPGAKEQPSVLLTYPSYLGRLVTAGLRLGHTPADFGLERIMIGGEVVTQALLHRCRVLFGDVQIEESYGITEAYPLGGVVCEQGHLHFEPSTGCVEVVDPANGEPVAPGQIGALALTPFAPFRESIVLLRYNSEDLVQRLAEPCGCSLRHLPATGNVLGKVRFAVRHAAGWTCTRHVLEALEAVDELPLPARCSFWAHGGGVAVEVATPNVTANLRHQIADGLGARRVPLTRLHLVGDPTQLSKPLPLRGDLHEYSFGAPVAPMDSLADRRSWLAPAVNLSAEWKSREAM